MKTSIIVSLVAAMTLSAPAAADAGDAPERHHLGHRRMAFAYATALLRPASGYVAAPLDYPRDSDISTRNPGITCAVYALVTSTLPSEHPLAALGRRSLPHTPKLQFCPKPHPPPYPTSADRTTSRGRASRADLLRRACRWRLGATRNVSFGGSFRNARA
jgi:hypothetical protein